MRIAIVGANGHIGTELIFILDKSKSEIVPIVRNRMGASFLRYHGYNVLTADVSTREGAESSLRGVDFVLVAAYDGKLGKKARESNAALIANSAQYSAPGSKVALLSSVRVFSRKVDPTVKRFWFGPPYDKEKRHMENVLFQECKKNGKVPFALRLGHVLGANQPRTRRFRDMMKDEPLRFRVNPEAPSNVVHSVTLAEAILKCANSEVSPGSYSVVDHPQWTWKQVLEDSLPRGSRSPIEFVTSGSSGARGRGGLARPVMGYVKRQRELLFALRLVLPKNMLAKYEHANMLENLREEVGGLYERRPTYIHEFGYNPVPGPFIQGLSETKALLQAWSLPHGVFNQADPPDSTAM